MVSSISLNERIRKDLGDLLFWRENNRAVSNMIFDVMHVGNVDIE